MEQSIACKVTLVKDSENRAKHCFTASADELVRRDSMLSLLSGVLEIPAKELSVYSISRRSKKHQQKFIPLYSLQDYQCLKRSLCVKNHVKLLVTKKEDVPSNDDIEERIASIVDAKVSQAVDEKVAKTMDEKIAAKVDQFEQICEGFLGKVESLTAEINSPPELPVVEKCKELDEITHALQSVDLEGSNVEKIKALVDQFQTTKAKNGNYFSVKYKLNCHSLMLELTNYSDLPIKAGSTLLFGSGDELIEVPIGDHDIVESKKLLVNLDDHKVEPYNNFAEEGFFILGQPVFSSFGSDLASFLKKFQPTGSVSSSEIILPTVSVLQVGQPDVHKAESSSSVSVSEVENPAVSVNQPYVYVEDQDYDEYEILSASDISV